MTEDERRQRNRERCRAHYAAHREERLQKQRAYDATHPSQARVAAWRVTHRDQMLRGLQAYWATHRARLNAGRRKRSDAD